MTKLTPDVIKGVNYFTVNYKCENEKTSTGDKQAAIFIHDGKYYVDYERDGIFDTNFKIKRENGMMTDTINLTGKNGCKAVFSSETLFENARNQFVKANDVRIQELKGDYQQGLTAKEELKKAEILYKELKSNGFDVSSLDNLKKMSKNIAKSQGKELDKEISNFKTLFHPEAAEVIEEKAVNQAVSKESPAEIAVKKDAEDAVKNEKAQGPEKSESSTEPSATTVKTQKDEADNSTSQYEVKKGDNLWNIIKFNYTPAGATLSNKEIFKYINEIMRLNKDTIKNMNIISPNQILILPDENFWQN